MSSESESSARPISPPKGYALPAPGKAHLQCFYVPVASHTDCSVVCMYCGDGVDGDEEEIVKHVVQHCCPSIPKATRDKYIEGVSQRNISRKRARKDYNIEKEKRRSLGLTSVASCASLSSAGSSANLRRDEPWGSSYPKQNCKSLSRYVIFASSPFQAMAEQMEVRDADRFRHHLVDWGKFADGTDRIMIDGFQPRNDIAGEHCIFIASFHNNDVTLSQFSVFIVLLQSFVASLTILLPYYPVGTMERVEKEGIVATANTYAMLFSSLPSCGKPTKLVIYDIHTLQNRFFFHNSCVASLQTCIPLFCERLSSTGINTVVFPDDGAAKRFGDMFKSTGFDVVVCGKTRVGDQRIVRVQDGDCQGKDVVIVDDLVQTGGTLYQCACALKAQGARSVSAYVTHAVFPNQSWNKFLQKSPLNGGQPGPYHIFEKFWVTNSIPTTTAQMPADDVFEVLDILPQFLSDLDM